MANNLFISSIIIGVLFWIFIIALATPNYDENVINSFYSSLSVNYKIYVGIFFFLSLSLWGVNVIIFGFNIFFIHKVHTEIFKELLWFSVINIFFSITFIFWIIALVSIKLFLKKQKMLKNNDYQY